VNKISLTAAQREHLKKARSTSSGRSAHAVFGGHEHVLRQTLIALAGGHELGEHTNPGEATLQVLEGRIRLDSGSDSWEGTAGDLLVVPDAPHSVAAVTDAVVLLTTVVN
jgi:quercetin dioxygenase-like cupin family protein